MKLKLSELGRVVMMHTLSPSTQEAEADRSLWIRGQPGVQSEFQDSQNYTEEPYLGAERVEIKWLQFFSLKSQGK